MKTSSAVLATIPSAVVRIGSRDHSIMSMMANPSATDPPGELMIS